MHHFLPHRHHQFSQLLNNHHFFLAAKLLEHHLNSCFWLLRTRLVTNWLMSRRKIIFPWVCRQSWLCANELLPG